MGKYDAPGVADMAKDDKGYLDFYQPKCFLLSLYSYNLTFGWSEDC